MKRLLDYRTFVFDCDGVILNSNGAKTKGFYEVAKQFGEDVANLFVSYHIQNGGVSRYEKFAYLYDLLKERSLIDDSTPAVEDLVDQYAEFISSALKTCEIAKGLSALRAKTKNSRWLVASGGDQKELRSLFRERGIDRFFDGGIFGSPDSKISILRREVRQKNIVMPGLFLGDTPYDQMVSLECGLDFIFISEWSDVEISDFSADEKPCKVNSIYSLL